MFAANGPKRADWDSTNRVIAALQQEVERDDISPGLSRLWQELQPEIRAELAPDLRLCEPAALPNVVQAEPPAASALVRRPTVREVRVR